MCGIAGSFALAPDRRASADRVQRMTRMLAHRGPDAEGLWCSSDGRVALGHRRLAVIDLACGAQPMSDESGRFTLVFNGEIYNYRELRSQLSAQGLKFRTASDTEVLLRLLQRDWQNALRSLTGMFAFAVWDQLRGELLLARDRIGEKPLYYAVEDGCLSFASGFRPLRQTRSRTSGVDPRALDDFLTLGYVPAPRTIDADVSKLPAGTLLRANSGGTRLERYWHVAESPEPFTGTYDEAVDRLDEMITGAVRIRLRSDVPLGVFLSGGVDSSLVAAIAARHSPERVLTFSIGFDEADYDESGLAAVVADQIGTEHRAFRARPDLVDLLPEMVSHYGEPFGNSSALPIWLLAHETRKHVTVALGGDGGDEAFGGYNWYWTAKRLRGIDRLVPTSVTRSALTLARGSSPAVARIRRALSVLALPEGPQFAALRSFVGREEAAGLYYGELADSFGSRSGGRELLVRIYNGAEGSPLRRMRIVDIETYLADSLMPKVDVATMAHGLEARAPLLDHDLVRFALTLPDDWLSDRLGGKRILKDVLYRYLPEELFRRPKQGFSVPLEHWFTRALRSRVERLHESESLLSTGWLQPDALRAMVDEHARGHRDNSQRIFNLLVLEQWLRQN